MTEQIITSTEGSVITAAYIVNGVCRVSGIHWISMLVVRSDGAKRLMCMDDANKLIRVNGVPIVDYYAKRN